MGKPAKAKKRVRKIRRIMSVDEFIENQLSRYIRIHKEHEKEINYIG